MLAKNPVVAERAGAAVLERAVFFGEFHRVGVGSPHAGAQGVSEEDELIDEAVRVIGASAFKGFFAGQAPDVFRGEQAMERCGRGGHAVNDQGIGFAAREPRRD